MLREVVIKLLGTEEGANEVLRRAWERLEAMTLPPSQDARATLIVLAESEALTATEIRIREELSNGLTLAQALERYGHV